ncbi:LysR family transcriptional regulator [Rhizobium sp. AG207R]|uniref:LysR family transcriptional regulator n=1 Tax=Rhizobium sp. AG207R TaxID=2802287 RepID=UPI0022AC4B8A|nr:LysR family transcriptional regulator [Rhizobium sp. AG207R]MCZ3378422.1 LysR family transcriptional regulator [Rhizobium sp. AG207R]
METRFLRTFLTVVETSSIAAAARKENLTSSAVVQRLRALEEEIGSPLVQRAGHSMRPTEAGLSILERARLIVASADDLRDIASLDQEAGTLRIGVIHSMITGLLPEILSAMKSTRPGIDVYVQPGQSSELHECVAKETLDAAIIVEPPYAISKAIEFAELRRDPMILLCSAIELEDDPLTILKTRPFIRYDRKHWGGRVGDNYLKKIKVNPVERYELDSLEGIAALVDRGLGVSVVPDWLPPWPAGLQLRKIALAGATSRKVGLLYQRLSTRHRLLSAFLEEARSAISRKEATLQS